MIKQKQKLFVIKKYIMAKNAMEAIKFDKNILPDDVWIDEDWKKGNSKRLESSMGFVYHEEESSLDWDNINKKNDKQRKI